MYLYIRADGDGRVLITNDGMLITQDIEKLLPRGYMFDDFKDVVDDELISVWKFRPGSAIPRIEGYVETYEFPSIMMAKIGAKEMSDEEIYGLFMEGDEEIYEGDDMESICRKS